MQIKVSCMQFELCNSPNQYFLDSKKLRWSHSQHYFCKCKGTLNIEHVVLKKNKY